MTGDLRHFAGAVDVKADRRTSANELIVDFKSSALPCVYGELSSQGSRASFFRGNGLACWVADGSAGVSAVLPGTGLLLIFTPYRVRATKATLVSFRFQA